MTGYVAWVAFLGLLESFVATYALMITIGIVHAQVLPAVSPVGFNVVWGIVLLFEIAKMISDILKELSGLDS